MTPEMWTIIGVGVALAAVLMPGQRAMRRDLTALAGEVSDLRGETGRFRERMAREMGEIREQMAREMGDLRERLTRQEGLFEGYSRRPKKPKSV
ncbi:hypothetical protein [Candidatus Palauibacter sp.]|uniref:hypothetical protein n=1 Tax=Candidatus Palauibacter sp. TaxID=3101350 RepID=UPI003B01AE2A